MEEETTDKALEIGKISAIGSFHLFSGQMVSTLILAIGTIVLGLLILQSDYGLFAVAMIPTTTLLLFHEWGMGPAIIRRCAKARTESNGQDLRRIIISGLIFELSTGVILTVIAILTANLVATTLFNKPETGLLIALISITLIPTAIYSVVQSVFIGFEKMKFIAITATIQAIIQTLIAPLLVLLGYGVFGAIIGYVAGSLVASVTSLFLLYFVILRKLEKSRITNKDIINNLKSLLNYGIPLAIGTLVSGLLTQFYSVMIASNVNDLSLIGNYKIATNFTVFLTFFSVPIGTVLFPAFAKLDPKNDVNIIKSVFATSVKYASLLLVPSTMLVIVLSNSIVGSLYGEKWPFAPQFLVLIVLIYLLPALGSISVSGLLRAVGETKFLMIQNILNFAIGAIASFIVAPFFGISGVLIVTAVASIPPTILCLYKVWKKYGAKIDYLSSAKICISSFIAVITVYLLLNFLAITYWFELGVGFISFITIFLVCAPLIGAINLSDIQYLRAMLGSGILSRIMNIPFTVMEQVSKIKRYITINSKGV
jgi:O-antigen/teichoic acid export membrane protein